MVRTLGDEMAVGIDAALVLPGIAADASVVGCVGVLRQASLERSRVVAGILFRLNVIMLPETSMKLNFL